MLELARDHVLGPPRCLVRMGTLPEEFERVADRGEGIAELVAQRRQELDAPGVGQLALRDVLDRAHQSQRRGPVEGHPAARLYPPHGTVDPVDDAVLGEVAAIAGGIHRALEEGFGGCPISRVQPGEEDVTERDRFVGTDAPQPPDPRVPGSGSRCEVHVVDAQVGRLAGHAKARRALSECQFCLVPLGHVRAEAEDAVDVAPLVADGLVDEVEVAHGIRLPGGRRPNHGGRPGQERFAGPVYLVEQCGIALLCRPRQRVGHGLSQDVLASHQLEVAWRRELEDMLRSVQDTHEAGSLVEQLPPPALGGLEALGSLDLFSRLGTQHQHTADAVRRARHVDGAVAVGPVDVFPPAVPDDRHQGVLVPVRSLRLHDVLDLRTDDVPDLGPGVTPARAKDAGMLLRADGPAVGVVVEAAEFRAPEDEGRVPGGQQDANGGAEGQGPLLRRAERGRGPVEGADKLAHDAAALEKGGAVHLIVVGRHFRAYGRKLGHAGCSNSVWCAVRKNTPLYPGRSG